MAENYDRCAVRRAPARDWERIVSSGGLAQNLPLLRDLIVARLGGEYRMCATTEDRLLGLLVLRLVATGRDRTVQQAMKRLDNRMGRAQFPTE